MFLGNLACGMSKLARSICVSRSASRVVLVRPRKNLFYCGKGTKITNETSFFWLLCNAGNRVRQFFSSPTGRVGAGEGGKGWCLRVVSVSSVLSLNFLWCLHWFYRFILWDESQSFQYLRITFLVEFRVWCFSVQNLMLLYMLRGKGRGGGRSGRWWAGLAPS